MRRETFDEHRIGRWVVQFFEPRLWRLSAAVQVERNRFDHTNPTQQHLTSVCVALPTCSIRYRL